MTNVIAPKEFQQRLDAIKATIRYDDPTWQKAIKIGEALADKSASERPVSYLQAGTVNAAQKCANYAVLNHIWKKDIKSCLDGRVVNAL